MVDVTDDEVMAEMAKISLEQATSQIAQQAREYARHPFTQSLTGEMALTLFADAIESTNAKVWPKAPISQ